MMVPVGRLVLLRSVSKSEMVNALAYLTVPALIGPVVGPPLGGFITTYFHWRWIFWINAPIGLLGVALALKFIENIRERDVAPFDFKGFVLSGAGLLSLIFGLTVIGRGLAPAPVVVAMVVGGAALLALYVRHARGNPDAILDLGLLKTQTFMTAVVGGFLFRLGIGAIPFLLPLLLQVGFGLSPFESGSLTFAAAAGAMAMKFTASTILRHWGFRRVLIFNGVLSAAFLASYGLIGSGTPHALILDGLAGGRLFPLARIHRAQRARLRRHRSGPNEPRHQLRQRRAADVGRRRRRARRGLGSIHPVHARRRPAGSARHGVEFLRRRARLAVLGCVLLAARAGRGRGGLGAARRRAAGRGRGGRVSRLGNSLRHAMIQ